MLTYIPIVLIKVIEKSVIFNQSKEFQLESVYKKNRLKTHFFCSNYHIEFYLSMWKPILCQQIVNYILTWKNSKKMWVFSFRSDLVKLLFKVNRNAIFFRYLFELLTFFFYKLNDWNFFCKSSKIITSFFYTYHDTMQKKNKSQFFLHLLR